MYTCTNNKCTASLLIESENHVINEVLGEHCHSTIATWKTEHQVFWENGKRTALESVSTRPVNIIRTDFTINSNPSILQHQYFKSVRNTIYCEKIKIYPALPNTIIEVVTELWNRKNDGVFKYRGHQFIYVHYENHLIRITTKGNLNFMINWTTFMANGTFDYAPNDILQIYEYTIIHYY